LMSNAKIDEVTYNSAFFEAQSPASLRSARKIVPDVLSLVSPTSVVDLGCGVGTWLSVFREKGVSDILGVDGCYVDTDALLIPRDCFLPHDLATPIAVTRQFDLAISLEVGEHLPAEASDFLVDQLVGLANIVLFSAAIPGQGGFHHINEQWQSYWRDRFESRGYVPVDCIRHRFWRDPDVGAYYRQNMLLYVEQGLLASRPNLRAEAERGAVLPSDLVHPLLLDHVLTRQPNLRPLLRGLPAAILRAVKWRLGFR
jgi:SAM-dependent methyltransferase